MSLNFELGKISDYKTMCFDDQDRMRPVTEALIFATMAVDIGVINAKTVEKFITRLRAWELVHGNFLHARGPITAEEVRAHMGLVTNVFPQSGDAKFAAKLGRVFLDRARKDLVTAPEELNDAAG